MSPAKGINFLISGYRKRHKESKAGKTESVLVSTIGIGNTIGYQQLLDICSSDDILPVSAH